MDAAAAAAAVLVSRGLIELEKHRHYGKSLYIKCMVNIQVMHIDVHIFMHQHLETCNIVIE